MDHREERHEVGQYLITVRTVSGVLLHHIFLTDLLIKVEVGQGQLYSLSNLLFLHIQTSNIAVCHVRLFMSTKHSY